MKIMFRPYLRMLSSPLITAFRTVSKKSFPAYRSLEEDEIERIKKSWVLVKENDFRFIDILRQEMLCDIMMYELYFNPGRKADVCVSELTEFKNHPKNVYSTLDFIVGDLENENVIIEKMIEIGKNHGRLGISRKHISFMTSTIYQAVECTIGPCMFDRLVDQSWEKFLTSFNDVVGVTAMKNNCRDRIC
uniref:Neuroglobin n=1 Tax=Lygus hesperus TaxID=30085 RepID=A0A0A9Z6R2_LYGHE